MDTYYFITWELCCLFFWVKTPMCNILEFFDAIFCAPPWILLLSQCQWMSSRCRNKSGSISSPESAQPSDTVIFLFFLGGVAACDQPLTAQVRPGLVGADKVSWKVKSSDDVKNGSLGEGPKKEPSAAWRINICQAVKMRDRRLLQEGYTPMLTYLRLKLLTASYIWPPQWVMTAGQRRHFPKHLRGVWRLLVWPGDLPVAVDHLHQQPGGQEHQQDVHRDLRVERRGVWAGCGAQKQQGHVLFRGIPTWEIFLRLQRRVVECSHFSMACFWYGYCWF